MTTSINGKHQIEETAKRERLPGQPEVRPTVFGAIEAHGTSLRAVSRATGIDPGTLSRLANDELGYNISRKMIARVGEAIEGLSQGEWDDLHRAAGHVPEDIEAIFIKDAIAARIIRLVANMPKKKRLELFERLEEGL